MKKIIFSLMILVCLLPFSVYASSVVPTVYVTENRSVKPGETVVIEIKTVIPSGTEIQGIQIDFDYSDNFPEVDKSNTKISNNTTGWTTVGITRKNVLAIGDIEKNEAEIVGQLAFIIPSNATPGTTYTFLIEEAIAATSNDELKCNVEKSKVIITVDGEKTTPSQNDNSSFGSSIKDKEELKTDKLETAEWKNPFKDVKENDWFYANVQYVVENKLMKGVAADKFAPNDTLTRAMLVTVLYRNEGEPAVNKSIPFADVDMDAYYASAVIWAKQNGIVNGVTETEFAPDENITREQIAAIMFRYANFKGYDVSVGENTNILSYEDAENISEYAVASMQYVVGSGLIKGKTSTTLNPKDNATRAEIAAILQRFIENIK